MSLPICHFRFLIFVLETLKFKKKEHIVIGNVVSTLNWILPVVDGN